MRFAYMRVSTARQELERQRAIAEGCDEVFEEKVSGRAPASERVELARLLDKLRAGDVVVCHSIDRLSRDVSHLMEISEFIRSRGASLELVKEGLTIAPDALMSASDRLMFQMFGVFAEFERSIMLERQAEARAVARARGRDVGRRRRFSSEDALEIVRRYQEGVSVRRLARDFGDVSRSTIYRVLDEAGVREFRGSSSSSPSAGSPDASPVGS